MRVGRAGQWGRDGAGRWVRPVEGEAWGAGPGLGGGGVGGGGQAAAGGGVDGAAGGGGGGRAGDGRLVLLEGEKAVGGGGLDVAYMGDPVWSTYIMKRTLRERKP